ncbi:MAG: PQQ-dependent sugar dehydrogenase [Leptospiraceae bacterium]|nr:PQQ-dependent sugar dehydrogenase [Leptospiraceae bacterium]
MQILFILSLFLPFHITAQDTKRTNEISLELIASDLFSPVCFASPNDGSKLLFICEQRGVIKVIKKAEDKSRVFLDLSKKISKLNPNYSEKGLLGLAFHPNYKENRKFYVNYSAPAKVVGEDHRTVISEMVTSLSNPEKAMPQTERIILEISQPESNHNGGSILFGHDGYLYIATGDGGGAGDEHGTIGNSQDLTNLLGKILRIDVNHPILPYTIPLDNPNFPEVGKTEIYAYGLRNPWKISFDRKTKQLFVGDVGQDRFEEINIVEKGKNYGWRIMEGFECFNPKEGCNKTGLTLPIYVYDHSEGISVIGGYVFRGNKKSPYYGKYIFGDWNGKVFYLEETKGKWIRKNLKLKSPVEWKYIHSFGEDEVGNLYLLTQEERGVNKRGFLFLLKL